MPVLEGMVWYDTALCSGPRTEVILIIASLNAQRQPTEGAVSLVMTSNLDYHHKKVRELNWGKAKELRTARRDGDKPRRTRGGT